MTNYSYGKQLSSKYNDSKNVLKRHKGLPEELEIHSLLNEIEYNLDNVIYAALYDKVNEAIHDNIGKTLTVPNNDYINYITTYGYLLHTDISEDQLKQSLQSIENIGSSINGYILYIFFISLIILHFLFAVSKTPFTYIGVISFVFLIASFATIFSK